MTEKEELEIKQRMAELDFGAESQNNTIEMLKVMKEYKPEFVENFMKFLREEE